MPLVFPQDAAGLLSLPANTESGTTAPFVLNPGSPLSDALTSPSAPAPSAPPATSVSSLTGGTTGGSIAGAIADATGVTKLAQYTGLALLAVVLIAIGVFVLLKD